MFIKTRKSRMKKISTRESSFNSSALRHISSGSFLVTSLFHCAWLDLYNQTQLAGPVYPPTSWVMSSKKRKKKKKLKKKNTRVLPSTVAKCIRRDPYESIYWGQYTVQVHNQYPLPMMLVSGNLEEQDFSWLDLHLLWLFYSFKKKCLVLKKL